MPQKVRFPSLIALPKIHGVADMRQLCEFRRDFDVQPREPSLGASGGAATISEMAVKKIGAILHDYVPRVLSSQSNAMTREVRR